MEEGFKRRNFLSRFALFSGALASIPFDNLAKSIKQSLNSMNEKINPVITIKPLGFQWETQDPFLFCVHHEDYFPKGNESMEPDKSH